MITRAYGRAFAEYEIEDVYASAWTATLSALRTRGPAMADEELRAYILTAVANHASKEMRRRSRKPTGSLEAEREQVLAYGHLPLPDEITVGSETRGIARDVLTSLPKRRRAVMLLRFGWGLSPAEVCALVPGLSPRAYRKEVTRGTEEMIAGLGQVESGEWCKQREGLVRDLVAGTADESERRQALEHLEHCRSCSQLASRLSRELREAGGVIALGTVAGVIGAGKATILERLLHAVDGVRSAGVDLLERGQAALGSTSAASTAPASGALSAGVAAKVAGVGGAAKAVLACVGVSAAATACVATGVVPGVSLGGGPEENRAARIAAERASVPRREISPRRAVASVAAVSHAVTASDEVAPPAPEPHHPDAPEPPIRSPEPVGELPPAQEFDPVAQASPPSAGASPVAGPGSSGGGSSGSSSVADDEFGP